MPTPLIPNSESERLYIWATTTIQRFLPAAMLRTPASAQQFVRSDLRFPMRSRQVFKKFNFSL
ncbi:UNVERIFIED_CONTAM: hypothetical protein GTU68_055824 [Idotea baltica]|nr:hypothetical protein [Idotea baltica]